MNLNGDNANTNKKILFGYFLKWGGLIVLLTLVATFVGISARGAFLEKGSPFPSWTYDSKNEGLNVWTSWDSGFHYSLARDGYPSIQNDVPYTEIKVPAGSWVKVFLSSAELGDRRIPLPYGSGFNTLTNTVFLMGSPYIDTSVPIYHAYTNIPYCEYKGNIDFERDVSPAAASLVAPRACGRSSCDESYVTYFDAEASQVSYQEVYTKGSSSLPRVLQGTTRPYGFSDPYTGVGCRAVGDSDLSYSRNLDYTKSFTSFPFMPLYSQLARGFSAVFGDIVFAGIAVSISCYLLSSVFLFLFLRDYLGREESFYAVLAYIVFPFSFFNIAFLPVALFNMLFFMVLYYGAHKKPVHLVLGMFFLCYTSVLGLLALIPLYFLLVPKKNRMGYLWAALGGILPLIVHTFNLHALTADSLTLLSSRKPWYSGRSNFISGFINYYINLNASKVFEIFIVVALLSLCLAALSHAKDRQGRPLGKELFSFIAFFALIPVFNAGSAGFVEYTFVFTPLFIWLGGLLARKRSFRVLVPVSMLLYIVMMLLWSISSRLVV
jgi:hypothetical protein